MVVKSNKVWIWLAKDRDTGEIVDVSFGNREQIGAKERWESLPYVYRQRALCYTDF